MFAAVTSAALVGVAASPVRVEAHVSGGPKNTCTIVGLPDAAIREARERVRSAILASGFPFPKGKVTVNLSPADLPKVGSAYDLPIALGMLAAARMIPPGADRVVALGELALDGEVRGPRGSLAAGIVAVRREMPCIVASAAASEAALAGAKVAGVSSLAEAIGVARGDPVASHASGRVPVEIEVDGELVDLAVVRGQPDARRALEIAAAGGHHLLLFGPPGAGKTLLAKALPTLLPDLEPEEQLDVAQARAAGERPPRLSPRPPFRAPHHSATTVAILGGGSGVPVPGELTLADRGVLFLDELAEFPSHLLDSLRQPIEDGAVNVARKGTSVSFPARVQLVAATNPCPCGYLGDDRQPCNCSPSATERYKRRLSGPFLDRFDLRVTVPRLRPTELTGPPGESSELVRERVVAARRRQLERGRLNRKLGREALDEMDWGPGAVAALHEGMEASKLSARGWDRIRRVARTIADLQDRERIEQGDVVAALALRQTLWESVGESA